MSGNNFSKMSDFKLIRATSDGVIDFVKKYKYGSMASIAIAVFCAVVYCKKEWILRRLKVSKPRRKLKSTTDRFTEVLFFSDRNALCLDHINNKITCSEDCGYQKLLFLCEYLNSATESLDICVYTITSYKLAEVVLRKFEEGVAVRVITDDSMAYGDGSQIPVFRRKGVRVRVKPSSNLMHHKFAIVDKKILVNGSFNWTQQATFGNWENVIITSIPEELVQSYCDQFEELWKLLD